MSFAEFNSGVSMGGSGSSRDPLKVGLMFLGVLTAVIATIIFVCLIWKLIEVLVEKYRQKSVTRRREEPSEDEGQVEVKGRRGRLQLTTKAVEMLKSVFSPYSATKGRRQTDASKMEDGQERLYPAAAAAAAEAKKGVITAEFV